MRTMAGSTWLAQVASGVGTGVGACQLGWNFEGGVAEKGGRESSLQLLLFLQIALLNALNYTKLK